MQNQLMANPNQLLKTVWNQAKKELDRQGQNNVLVKNQPEGLGHTNSDCGYDWHVVKLD